MESKTLYAEDLSPTQKVPTQAEDPYLPGPVGTERPGEPVVQGHGRPPTGETPNKKEAGKSADAGVSDAKTSESELGRPGGFSVRPHCAEWVARARVRQQLPPAAEL